jgi:uncharacterized membrane protein
MVDSPLFLLLLFIPAAILFRTRQKKRDRKTRISQILYFFSFLLLTLALSGFGIIKEKSKDYRVFVVDVSDSISVEAQLNAERIINEYLNGMKPEDYAGIVLFGEKGMIERNLQNNAGMMTYESLVAARSTNIEEALTTAMGMFPEKGKRSIILLSDGLENSGNSRRAAVRAASAGIRIFTIPLNSEIPESEVYIHDLILPAKIRKNQIHDYSLIIGSTIQTTSLITFFKNGTYMGEEKVLLFEGLNTFTYTSIMEHSGIHEYRAVIEPETDTYRENNIITVPVTVSGEPKVLIVSQDDSTYLIDALKTQNIEAENRPPSRIPASPGMLLEYDSIIFNNIPSGSVSYNQMHLIKDFVKNKGGGFLMIGGEQSFGAGGYYNTPLEEILPVDMDVTSTLQIPSLTMIMVIDRSGSMKTAVGRGVNKLDVAKEAVMEAVEILNPFYKVGIIAFDTEFFFAVPLIEAGESETISRQLMEVIPAGGTDLFPAMEAAFKELKQSDSAVRHMIILSDGLSDKGDFEILSRAVSEAGISVSTVAVGDDSDKELLEDIAEWGSGRSYYTSDIREVPRIFASESFIVSRAHIVEETFIPEVTSDHNVISGLENFFPALDGFVLTYPKSGATHILTTTDGHPLLSLWKYGLGRTASWSSDFGGRWGGKLVEWEMFPKLAAQLVRWIERPIHSENLTFSFQGSGKSKKLIINARDDDKNFINNLKLDGIISSSNGSEQSISITQKGPGLYEAYVELHSEGTNILTVFDRNNAIDPDFTGISLPYSSEFKPMKEDFTLLIELADTSGGTIMSSDSNALSPIPEIEGKTGTRDMKEILSLFAMLLFILNIIIRLLPEATGKNGSNRIEDESLDKLRLKIDEGKKQSLHNRRKDTFWFG